MRDAPPPNAVRRDITLSPEQVGLLSIPIILVVLALCLVPFRLLWGWDALRDGFETALQPLVFFPVFILGIVVHEGLHALGWRLFGRVPFHTMQFGVKSLMPFAHCRVPMAVTPYRWGVVLPGFITGVVPAAVGLLVGNGFLLVWGSLFLTAASGDVLVLWALRDVPAAALVKDHPSLPGCEVWLPAPE